MRRRRRRDTEPTQPISPLPPRHDPFWRLPLEVQREVVDFLDNVTPAAEVRR